MDGIGGKVELAALPGGRPEYRPASGAQSCMIIRHDEFDASHAAGDQVIEEAAPVDLSLRQGDADTEHPAAFVRSDPDRREYRSIAHNAALANFLVPRVEDEVTDLAQWAGPPRLQLLVKQGRSAADLRRRHSLDAKFAQHGLGLTGGNTLHVLSATASMTARTERHPRSSDCG